MKLQIGNKEYNINFVQELIKLNYYGINKTLEIYLDNFKEMSLNIINDIQQNEGNLVILNNTNTHYYTMNICNEFSIDDINQILILKVKI